MITFQKSWPYRWITRPNTPSKRGAFSLAMVLFLIAVPTDPSHAQVTGLLQQSYSGNGLTLTIRKDQAEIFYAGHLCIGHLEDGRIEKRSAGLFIVAENCEIALTLREDGGLDLDQGPGCTWYHGARCSLSGRVYPDR